MKVLVLGGTGAMGAYLVRLLVEQGHNVAVTSRTERSVENGVRWILGDAQDNGFMMSLLTESWDAIVDFMVYSTEEFRVRRNHFLNATAQYFFLSSARVYAESSGFITENSSRLLDVSVDRDFLASDEYALSKARQEDLLRESFRRNWTIIRPYITYSDKRLQLGVLEKEAWLYRALQGRPIVLSQDINNKMTTLTHGFDVSRGIASLIGVKDAMGEAFHITSPRPIRWSNVLELYLDVLEEHIGRRPEVVLQSVSEVCEWHPGRYQIIYDRLFDRQFDNKKISAFANVSDFMEPRVGLAEGLRTFLQAPRFLAMNWRSEAIKDRAVDARAGLKEIFGLKDRFKYMVFRYM